MEGGSWLVLRSLQSAGSRGQACVVIKTRQGAYNLYLGFWVLAGGLHVKYG